MSETDMDVEAQPVVAPVEESQMSEEIAKLRREMETLNAHRFVRLHNSIPKLMLFQLMRGMAFGLGTLLGATLLVSWIVYSLSSIDFIPVIGEWAAEIVDVITQKAPDS